MGSVVAELCRGSVGIESIWDGYRTIKWTQQPCVHIELLMMAVNIFIWTISCLPVVVEVRCDHQNQDVVVRWIFTSCCRSSFFFLLFSTVRLTFFSSLGHTTFFKNTQLRFFLSLKLKLCIHRNVLTLLFGVNYVYKKQSERGEWSLLKWRFLPKQKIFLGVKPSKKNLFSSERNDDATLLFTSQAGSPPVWRWYPHQHDLQLIRSVL